MKEGGGSGGQSQLLLSTFTLLPPSSSLVIPEALWREPARLLRWSERPRAGISSAMKRSAIEFARLITLCFGFFLCSLSVNSRVWVFVIITEYYNGWAVNPPGPLLRYKVKICSFGDARLWQLTSNPSDDSSHLVASCSCATSQSLSCSSSGL